jgi:pimeloyl-ACP methyl ester carboxylesterase
VRFTDRALSTLYASLGGRTERLEHPRGTLTLRHLGTRTGDGIPWLLIHGLANTSIAWLPVAAAVRRRHRIALPELTDLGGSVSPHGALDVEESVEALSHWLERSGIGSVFVVGISLGGWVAARLALAQPQRVAGLALVNAAGYRDQDWERIQGLIDIRDPAGTAGLLDAMFLRRRRLLRWVEGPMYRVFTQPSVKGVLSRLREEQALTDADLSRLTMPTLLLWGVLDGLFPVEVGHRMAAAIPGARLEVISGAAHAVTWERPRVVTGALESFARTLRAPESREPRLSPVLR